MLEKLAIPFRGSISTLIVGFLKPSSENANGGAGFLPHISPPPAEIISLQGFSIFVN